MHTLKELEEIPTISESQADDLKIDEPQRRVWLCRCGLEDGMPHDNNVTVEGIVNGCWVTHEEYEAL